MIAVDTCVIIAFLEGDAGPAVETFKALLASDEAVVAPSTVTELLSAPGGGPESGAIAARLKRLPIEDGYWERTGAMRAAVRRAGRRAALGDALIAQACLDADVALLTADADFKAFAAVAGLKLA